MKKLVVIGLTALVTLFVTLGVAPSAYAYPELSCNVEVDAQVVDSGESFTATGTSQQVTVDNGRSSADAADWTMTFNGDVRTGEAVTFTQTFTAPEVTETTKIPLTATAVMQDGTTTCSKTVDITVVPGGTTVLPPEEELPNTGGPRLALLFAGLGLVLAGGVAIRQSRKGHDVPGS
jgi:LPXTG-motif cell wall-anchored protein